ncbi:hypothetical protein KC316_g13341 [Hortaea werneckii]|nr:hypothetical protein KC316_g13341 [Hortaea werneckii]
MPLPPQRPHHHFRNRLPALPTLGTIPMGMTPDTPRIIVLLDKRGGSIKGIAAGSAGEMPFVVGVAAGDDDAGFDRGTAGFAAGGEELVVVEVAVESRRLVYAVGEVELVGFGRGCGFRGERGREAGLPGVDARKAVVPFRFGFWVEGDEFEVRVALVADEAGWVETFAGGAEDAAGDWEGAVGAEGA